MANDNQLSNEEAAQLDLLLSVPLGEAVASFGARRVAAVALILGTVDESEADRGEARTSQASFLGFGDEMSDPGEALDQLYAVADFPLRRLCTDGHGLLAAAIAIKLRRIYGEPLTPDQTARLEEARALLLGIVGEVAAGVDEVKIG